MNPVSQGKPYVVGSMGPYVYEVFQQCFAATEAWNRALSRLETVPTGGPEAPMIASLQIVSDLQGFAVAVGILSDLFFPDAGGGREARGERLRALYGVQNGSSRLENANVQVRHSLVHLDKELDKWLALKVGQTVGPVTIQPWVGQAPTPTTASHARIIDNENWRLLVLGEVMDFKPLLLEVGEISQKNPLEVDTPNGSVRLAIAPPK
ncbi:MAG: hypothetical protein L3K16_08500 [Thermoplasmata archaeon]|nr:hypothetical protein [Thermoplasmata archaeon]